MVSQFWKRFLYRNITGHVIAHQSRFSGSFIGSPSLCRLTETHFLASHDLFGPHSQEFTKPITYIWKTTDAGVNWSRISVVLGAFWSQLFTHNGVLYLLGTNRHHGDLVISRSNDGGATWSVPRDADSGLLRLGMFHLAPNPMVTIGDMLYMAVELADGPVAQWGKRYGACVLSVPAGADLLDASAWRLSNVLYYDASYLNGNFGGWLEGNIVVGPDGVIHTLLRVEDDSTFSEKAALTTFDTITNRLTFDPTSDFVLFPGGSKKFSVIFDVVSGAYIALANVIHESDQNIYLTEPDQIRNSVAMITSKDLRSWRIAKVIMVAPDITRTAFQYINFVFDGEDIAFVSRTAATDWTGGARSYHDANFLTFHRITQFRQYL